MLSFNSKGIPQFVASAIKVKVNIRNNFAFFLDKIERIFSATRVFLFVSLLSIVVVKNFSFGFEIIAIPVSPLHHFSINESWLIVILPKLGSII
jgi:hypothetical protein